jgi:hypothetical protein
MQLVEVRYRGTDLAAAMTTMRTWLDHNQAEPALFEFALQPPRAVRFRLHFRDPTTAAAFAGAFDGVLLQEIEQAAA